MPDATVRKGQVVGYGVLFRSTREPRWLHMLEDVVPLGEAREALDGNGLPRLNLRTPHVLVKLVAMGDEVDA